MLNRILLSLLGGSQEITLTLKNSSFKNGYSFRLTFHDFRQMRTDLCYVQEQEMGQLQYLKLIQGYILFNILENNIIFCLNRVIYYSYINFKALCTLLSRILGRFAPIFYFNCKHVLFVYIENKTKNFGDFLKKIENFQNFQNILQKKNF